LKLILLGRGRMGREVSRIAGERGHEVVLEVDRNDWGGVPTSSDGCAELPGADAIIDFTGPEEVLGNVGRTAGCGIPIVVGTTGWQGHLREVESRIRETQGALVYGSNFSLGMNLFHRLVVHAAALFDRFEEFDPYMIEHHHQEKVDAPSGTAITLAEVLVDRINRKTRTVYELPAGSLDSHDLHVTSVRAGAEFGRHLVGFDGPFDAVTLEHRSRGRTAFASGALLAAQLIQGKKGVHRFESLVDEMVDIDG